MLKKCHLLLSALLLFQHDASVSFFLVSKYTLVHNTQEKGVIPSAFLQSTFRAAKFASVGLVERRGPHLACGQGIADNNSLVSIRCNYSDCADFSEDGVKLDNVAHHFAIQGDGKIRDECAARNIQNNTSLTGLKKKSLSVGLAVAGVGALNQRKNIPELHLAAKQGDTSAIAALLLSGTDPDTRDRLGKTALHYAIDAAAVDALVGGGAEVNAVAANLWTPLHSAAWDGRAGTAQTLLLHGAAANALDRWNREAPLHYARCADVVRALTEVRAPNPMKPLGRAGSVL
jgi:ankyrin repeat protein